MTEPVRGTTLVGRRRTPPWIWLALLLGALVLLALLWMLLTRNNDGLTAGGSARPSASLIASSGNGSAASPGGAVVSDVAELVNASDAQSVAGSRVALTGVTVQSVVGDKTFWVGPSADEQVFVVIEEDETGGSVEGGVDVQQGQTISLAGVVRQTPSKDDAMRRWNLSEADATALADTKLFIRAQQVQVSQ